MTNKGTIGLFVVLVQSLAAIIVLPVAHGLANYAIPTELGQDAICWESNEEGGGEQLRIKNPLVRDFQFGDRVALLGSCPEGNSLRASAPVELLQGQRMRTLQYYNFTVSGTLNLTSLRPQAPSLVADDGPVVAVQIVACELGRAGFCSPFIHEEANARINAKLAARGGERRRLKFQPGDRHGDTHVHSRYQYVELPPEDGPFYSFTIDVPFIVNLPGNFFTIADVQLHLGNNTTGVLRYDIANALVDDQRLISYQAPAEILDVTSSVRIISYVCIGAVASTIIFLLVQTIWHRNHHVLELTQGYFLIIFLLAALTATVASFLLEPKNDTYCQTSLPIIMCSAQLLYAVTLGRLWRINAVISPLLVQTLGQQTGWAYKFMQVLRKCCSMPQQSTKKSKSLRQKVASGQLVMIITIFTAPQVVIQSLGILLQLPYRDIDYNNDESKGRAFCNSGSSHVGNTIQFYGFICFGLLIVILLAMAHRARALPSLFNETRDIFSSTLTTLVVFVLGGGIVAVANSPTTSPAVQYLVSVALTLSITFQTACRIMLPKLRMIWSGEIVLVSKLVTDHRASIQKKNDLYHRKKQQRSSTMTAPASSLSFPSPARGSTSSSAQFISEDLLSVDSTDFCCPVQQQYPTSTKFSHRRPIVLKRDEAPDRRLVLELVYLQNTLARVNERIMSGMTVADEDWKSLRLKSRTLGLTFEKNVEFAWERMSSKEQAPETITDLPLGNDDEMDKAYSGEGDDEDEVVNKDHEQSATVGDRIIL